jgi:hypothetical protein
MLKYYYLEIHWVMLLPRKHSFSLIVHTWENFNKEQTITLYRFFSPFHVFLAYNKIFFLTTCFVNSSPEVTFQIALIYWMFPSFSMFFVVQKRNIIWRYNYNKYLINVGHSSGVIQSSYKQWDTSFKAYNFSSTGLPTERMMQILWLTGPAVQKHNKHSKSLLNVQNSPVEI